MVDTRVVARSSRPARCTFMSGTDQATPALRGRRRQTVQILGAVGLIVGFAGFKWLREAEPTPFAIDASGFQFESGGNIIRVDEFLPDKADRRPTVFLLHGSGGLGAGVMEAARDLARHGYAAMVLHY